jgi:hypothetical protein
VLSAKPCATPLISRAGRMGIHRAVVPGSSSLYGVARFALVGDRRDQSRNLSQGRALRPLGSSTRPAWQAHRARPTWLIHCCALPPLSVAHSSTSWQCSPLPSKLALHSHRKLPGRSVQSAWTWQPWVPAAHSSTRPSWKE